MRRGFPAHAYSVARMRTVRADASNEGGHVTITDESVESIQTYSTVVAGSGEAELAGGWKKNRQVRLENFIFNKLYND